MTKWVIETTEKKSVDETEIWIKGELTIRRVTGWRWGKAYCEHDEKPNIDLDNSAGLEVLNTAFDFEIDSLDDGWFDEVEWPDEMDEDEQNRLIDLWDEDAHDAWERAGWEHTDTETWFYGPLSLTAE